MEIAYEDTIRKFDFPGEIPVLMSGLELLLEKGTVTDYQPRTLPKPRETGRFRFHLWMKHPKKGPVIMPVDVKQIQIPEEFMLATANEAALWWVAKITILKVFGVRLKRVEDARLIRDKL